MNYLLRFCPAIFITIFLICPLFLLSQTTNTTDNAIIQLQKEYRQDAGSLSRYYFVQGSHERNNRFKAFYNRYKTELSRLSFNNLSTSGKVDYILFQSELNNELELLAKSVKSRNEVEPWLVNAEIVYQLEKQRRRGKHLNSRNIAGKLDQLAKDVAGATQKLKKEKPTFSKLALQEADKVIQGQKEALESVYHFYSGYDPSFNWWIERPYDTLVQNLHSFREEFTRHLDSLSLSKDDGSGIMGIPIGRAEVIRRLENAFIPYTPERLIEQAEKDFAFCQNELQKAATEMGYSRDWKKAQEKVKQAHVKEGMQPDHLMKIYDESIQFLRDHNLITIPDLAEETWRMTMLSAERQKVAPFFLGGEVLQIAYPTEEMPHDHKMMSMRGNNPHFSKAVLHHEIIPGHHLQQYMNRRHKSYRQFRTPFWTEGWALYWELLLYDMDFAKTPEDRIGMLFWRMHRNARIIFSLNYHLEKWTPKQCIDYLVDKVGHERANAEAEVRRSFTGGYGPLYQIAYMVGGLQFMALKEELVDSGKMTIKEYHDAVLHENSMPVEMIRAILTNAPLTKNYKTNWKFLD